MTPVAIASRLSMSEAGLDRIAPVPGYNPAMVDEQSGGGASFSAGATSPSPIAGRGQKQGNGSSRKTDLTRTRNE